MKPNSPEIVKASERLLLEIVKSADGFPRKCRYSLGADLREDGVQAVLLSQEAFRASSRPQQQSNLVEQLGIKLDRIRAHWQVAFKLQCFSFERSEEIGRLIDDIGRQCGGWKRSIDKRLMGQSPTASGQRERAPTLSTCAASSEASR